jgi:hypothetical protein
VFKYQRIKYLLSKYKKYIKNPNWEFSEYKLEILKSFRDAGVEDTGITAKEHVGYGTIKVQTVSSFLNITNVSPEVIDANMQNFYSVIGYYKLKIIETFNPVYWAELLIFLPKHILNYFGLKSFSTIKNVFQIAYWIIIIISFCTKIIDNEHINKIIKSLLEIN